MIDIIKQTPIEYSAQSRDYQVLARLYSALFNVSKMYIDNLTIWNNDIDNRLATLRSKTLNFDAKLSWDENDLEAVTSCFKYLMKKKGTMRVLEYCVNILMKIQGIVGETIDTPIVIDNYTITVRVPEKLLTLGVLEDLLSYVLPAGLIFNIVRYKSSNISNLLRTEVVYEDIDYDSEGNIINYSQEPYSDKMYIGASKDYEYETVPGEIIEMPITKDKDYWLMMHSNNIVPEDEDGLNAAWLYDSEGNLITELSKEDMSGRNISGVIERDPYTPVNKVKKITDTFIYAKTDDLIINEDPDKSEKHTNIDSRGDVKLRKEGAIIYEEDWEED